MRTKFGSIRSTRNSKIQVLVCKFHQPNSATIIRMLEQLLVVYKVLLLAFYADVGTVASSITHKSVGSPLLFSIYCAAKVRTDCLCCSLSLNIDYNCIRTWKILKNILFSSKIWQPYKLVALPIIMRMLVWGLLPDPIKADVGTANDVYNIYGKLLTYILTNFHGD